MAHEQDLAILKARAAEGQWPVVGILACADSRVPVEMVFDEPIGRLFVARIAGNIATPEIIASLEYGIAVLGIKALIVMGHSDCGAVKSAIKNPEVPGQISALFPAILPAIYLSKTRELDEVVRTNATVQAATLMNASTVVEAAVKAGTLKVVPAVYDVATGKVELLAVPRDAAQRLTRRSGAVSVAPRTSGVAPGTALPPRRRQPTVARSGSNQGDDPHAHRPRCSRRLDPRALARPRRRPRELQDGAPVRSRAGPTSPRPTRSRACCSPGSATRRRSRRCRFRSATRR